MPTTPVNHATECLHGLEAAWCSLCRKADGWQPGRDRQVSDCTVVTVQHLTGATYPEAVALMADAGRKGGHGAYAEQVHAALAAAGWTATPYAGTVADAVRDGGTFHVSARRGSRGHSYAVAGGQVLNALGYERAASYRVWRVA